jgi:hypothetical protein
MEMKYFYQSMNHLPLRYATYRSKLNIPFAVLTLNMELEINKVIHIFQHLKCNLQGA